MKNEKIFITGGTGFLGRNIIKKFYDHNDITVYSRDESKQYYLKKEYPKVNFICGDIRNYDLMLRSSRDHTIGIYAASFKQIQSCHDNYEEANQVIVQGAFNSRRCSEENNFKSACFISSDKSRSATTIYGGMKYVAGESFISNSNKSDVKLSTVIYGNVLNSTGSILPLIWKSIEDNFSLSLYSEDMTRFFIDVDDAVSLIEKSLEYDGYNIIPSLKSMRILDLFEIFKEEFGLIYNVSQPRSCEKIHEILASQDEIPRMKIDRDLYLMHQDEVYNEVFFQNNQYSSENFAISKEELYSLLKEKNFYRPNKKLVITDKDKLKNFPTINFVSIEESEDRRNVLYEKFKNYGIEKFQGHVFERFNLDKHSNNIENIDSVINSEAINLMKQSCDVQSYLGAITSHLKAIRNWYVNTDEECAIFCEDDLSFETVRYWNFTWDDFMNILPEGWGCIQLALTRGDMFEYYKPKVYLRTRCWDDFSCTCYLITRTHAKNLLDSYYDGEKFTLEYSGIDYWMKPQIFKDATVENIVYTIFDYNIFTFPLFVENIKLKSTVWNSRSGKPEEEYSYNNIMNWWKSKGQFCKIRDFKSE